MQFDLDQEQQKDLRMEGILVLAQVQVLQLFEAKVNQRDRFECRCLPSNRVWQKKGMQLDLGQMNKKGKAFST